MTVDFWFYHSISTSAMDKEKSITVHYYKRPLSKSKRKKIHMFVKHNCIKLHNNCINIINSFFPPTYPTYLLSIQKTVDGL